ncbi:poly(ADP-ribose) glycohydrolase [Agrilus planipennis]|uniref:poly(ADP-ribose) glycohydrolase n=1 Tax=Agrilus planipennis TaxID=224129 RepID=A0A1W4WD06_AGRPL|nr:poly(ADP-ribose) glycohydrolase [Agrilus planipennis]
MNENSNTKSWVGTSLNEIYGKWGPWNYITDPVTPSRYNHVFYNLETVDLKNPPKPYCSSEKLLWDNDNVRMPFCEKNLFPVQNDDGTEVLKPRWEIIQTSLLQTINNSRELEALMNTYNTRLPRLINLHHFFEEELEQEEAEHFFKNVLPGIIDLALQLPHLVQKNVPLLKQGVQKSLTLTQQQIASLLANAFLCTFPWRKDTATSYPGVNFIRIFGFQYKPTRQNAIMNKLRCICHYFRKVLVKSPVGVVTFERKSLSKHLFPRWDKEENNLGNTRIHICSEGKIEDAKGLLQVDFANKNVGGGVLGSGCVQEEIRYIISPELIISRLFTERLDSNEALVVIGAERYSKYKGYGDSFEWAGNCEDLTPYDEYGRRRTTIVAIDAIPFRKASDQYTSALMLRELNKAYVGFYSRFEKHLPAVATGNWGCGAFRGNPYLKSLLQFMACSATKRDLVYFTFGDSELRDSIYNMYTFIATNQITTGKLWRYLCSFSNSKLSGDSLFAFIQQAHFDVKKQLAITDFMKNFSTEAPSTSFSSKSFKKSSLLGENEAKTVTSQDSPDATISIDEGIDDRQESSQAEDSILKNMFCIKKKSEESGSKTEQKETTAKPQIDSRKILNLFQKIDGNVEVTETRTSFSMEIDTLNEVPTNENVEEEITNDSGCLTQSEETLMELDEVVVQKNEELTFNRNSLKPNKPQKKITDFFKTSSPR